jgi:hypothetical protein
LSTYFKNPQEEEEAYLFFITLLVMDRNSVFLLKTEDEQTYVSNVGQTAQSKGGFNMEALLVGLVAVFVAALLTRFSPLVFKLGKKEGLRYLVEEVFGNEGFGFMVILVVILVVLGCVHIYYDPSLGLAILAILAVLTVSVAPFLILTCLIRLRFEPSEKKEDLVKEAFRVVVVVFVGTLVISLAAAGYYFLFSLVPN